LNNVDYINQNEIIQNQSINFKNGKKNCANYNSFDYINYEELTNEFANNLNYPSLEKIENEANYSKENLIKK
jgi:hypothetical protein